MKTSKKIIVTTFTVSMVMFFIIIASSCAPRTSEVGAPIDMLATAEMKINWTPDSDCAVCHTSEELSRADKTNMSGVHEPPTVPEEVACITCHDDIEALTTVHADAVADPNTDAWMRLSEVPSAACEAAGCHDDDKQERILATAELDLLTDRDGTTVNPHDMPQHADHDTVICSDCHKGHMVSSPESVCIGCHHKNVYECGNPICHEGRDGP